MATVDDLSVRVSASTADFTTGMGRAEDALSDVRDDAILTSGAMQVLQGRMDEAGDEASQAGAQASASSGGFLGLASSAATAEVSFSSLSLVTATALIPSLIALSSVVAPLAAALGGFITVAGAIGGIGLVGFLGAAATRSERLKSTFNELKSTLQAELAPVFDVFAGVLERLMTELTAIVPELVPARKVIKQIAAQFEQLGSAIISVLPAFVDLAVQLTQRFLPPFVEWALTKLTNIVTGAMRAINGLDKQTAGLVSGLIIASPVIAKVALALSGLSNPALAAALAIGALGTAFATNFKGIRTHVMNALRSVQQFVASLQLGGIVKSVGLVKNLEGAFRDLAGIGQTLITGVRHSELHHPTG